ncbi:MAG: DNA polymerase III subunit beta [Bryobacterales bacterium]|nr:DNA polymerase III subunit beta [Bryobacterales bacterium]
MELSIGVQALVAELKLASTVFDDQGFDLVRYEAGDGTLSFSASGSSLWLNSACEADVLSTGTAVARVRRPLSYLELLPADKTLRLKYENGDTHMRMRVVDATPAAQTPTLQAEAFKLPQGLFGADLEPDASQPQAAGVRWSLPAEPLLEAIRRTFMCVASEGTRYTVPGGQLVMTPEKVGMVSTDGHRLSRYFREAAVEGPAGGHVSVIGRQALASLTGILSAAAAAEGPTPPVTVAALGNDRIFFECGPRRLACQQVEGKFPDHQRVMPDEFQANFEVNRLEFYRVLRRVALFAEKRTPAVRFDLDDGRLTMTPHIGNGQLADTSKESVKVDFGGEPAAVGLNAKYVLEFLEQARSPQVLMSLNHPPRGSVQLQETGLPKDTDYRYLIMPIRL